MKPTSIVGRVATLFIAAAGAGCIALPMHVYVADEAAGSPVHERCSFNPDVPVGVRVAAPGLEAVVSVTEEGDHGIVGVRFDVPPGRTLVLREAIIRVDAGDGRPVLRAPIPHVNPAAPARYPETETMKLLPLPADAPLPGGRLNLGRLSEKIPHAHRKLQTHKDLRTCHALRIDLPEPSADPDR